jgi:hypothetical protein
MQISGVSLTLTWSLRLCLLRVLHGAMPLLQAFSFPSTLGEVTLRQLSQACVFIYNSHWKWVFPPLLWSFPPTTNFTSFPAPDCWACATAPAFSSWLVGRNFPSPPSVLSLPHPLCYVSFLLLLLIIQFFSLFSLGWGQEAMLIWPRVVCGSTMCCLAHLVVCVFPSHLGAGDWWQLRGPPGFSINMEWRCYVQDGGVEGSKFCLFLVIFPVSYVSSTSPRFYFRRHVFCFLPLAAILELDLEE